MNALSRNLFLFALLAAALLAPACSKKAPKRQAAEPVTTPAPAPAAKPAPESPAPAPAAEAPMPTPPAPEPALAGVSPQMQAADAAYEVWFKKNGLDLNDPKMLDEDPDSDGFSNREEFLAETNPHDPNSRPGVATNIRLQEFVRKEVPFVLKTVQGETAQIEHSEEGKTRTETVKTGQALPGSSYKVTRVQTRNMRDKDGNAVDGSRVTLEDPATKERVELIKDTPTRSSGSYAVLKSPDGKTAVTVRDGETFTWPGEPPVEYKVKDLRAEQVILEEVGTRKIVTVPKG